MRAFKIVFLGILFFSAPFLHSKVYDCFMFNHELDLLEIRLNEMYDYVDHFVLVECTQTHRATPKPLYYGLNKARFEKFNNKIIHVIVYDQLRTSDLWAIEEFQRNQISRGLKGCSANDTIIISDLDEIIRGKDLSGIIANLDRYPYVACQLDLFVYYLNGLCGQWNGPVLTKYSNVLRIGANAVRNVRNSSFTVQNSGWHFSSTGGVQATLVKYASNVHGAEYPNITGESILSSIKVTPCIPVDSLFPQCVIDHLDTYIKNGLINENCTSTRELIGSHIHW